MIVFGLGSGGCGLASLAELLRIQHRSTVTKERFLSATGWTGSVFVECGLARMCQEESDNGALAGDVAWYHLPYVWELARRHPEARFVCLQRERAATVDALLQAWANTHPLLEHAGGPFKWNPTQSAWPSLGIPDQRLSVKAYVEVYYSAVSILSGMVEHFRVFPTSFLDHECGQRQILAFLGIDERAVVKPEGVNVHGTSPRMVS